VEASRGGVEARRGTENRNLESYLSVGKKATVSGSRLLGVTSTTTKQP
jgi:hypothetical protein